MGALSRFSILTTLMLLLPASAVLGAELTVGMPLGTYVSSIAPFTLEVTLQALSVTGAKYVRSSWIDEVDVTASDERGAMLPIRVLARRKGAESIISSTVPRNGIMEDGVVRTCQIDVDGFPEGRVTIRVEYRGLKNEIMMTVPKGDEKEMAQWRAKQRGTPVKHQTYAEFRAEALRRLETSEKPPNDVALRWDLAEFAIHDAPQEEAEKYLRMALDAQRAHIDWMRASGRPGVLGLERELRSAEAMARAILSVLPEYCANRERRSLYLDWQLHLVLLQDRETHETLRTVHASMPDRWVPADVAPE